jgi:NAD(P)-dependent dehydrogenase (short-subunit alcohol dehydrogenase family)
MTPDSGRFNAKVAFIIGAARGQGRAEAVRLTSDRSRHVTGVELSIDQGTMLR